MSVLRLYKDQNLGQMVSAEGDFSNPDEEMSLDGGAGQTADRELWLAVEQTALGADIADTETTQVSLVAPRFADTAYPVVIIGSEKMLITAGHGSDSLTVLRGHNGTPKAPHSAGDPVRLAYDASGIGIECRDTLGSDESGWVGYCLDSGGGPDGVWGAPLGLGALNFNQSLKIWRRVSVPTGTPAAIKQDLVHRVTATVVETA